MTKKKARQRAIREHRRMWRWIAKQYRKGKETDVHKLKEEYVKMNRKKWKGMYGNYINANCFCCWFSEIKGKGIDCSCICPLEWGQDDICETKEMCMKPGSPFLIMISTKECNCASKLAKEISELPERTEV